MDRHHLVDKVGGYRLVGYGWDGCQFGAQTQKKVTNGKVQEVANTGGWKRAAVAYLTENLTAPAVVCTPRASPIGVATS